MEEVIDATSREVGNWLFVAENFKDLSLADFIRDWCNSISFDPSKEIRFSSWLPPHMSGLKLNFDGASEGNPRPAGFACMVRDHNGGILCVLCGPFGVCNSTETEVLSLLMGLRELKKLRLLGCIIEGDSLVTIGWRMGKDCASWRMWQHVYEIREISSLLSCSFIHVSREQNGLADTLANWGVGIPSIYSGPSLPEGCL